MVFLYDYFLMVVKILVGIKDIMRRIKVIKIKVLISWFIFLFFFMKILFFSGFNKLFSFLFSFVNIRFMMGIFSKV